MGKVRANNIRTNNVRANNEGLEKALDVIGNGGTIVYPTDTLYGIGASIGHHDAIFSIFEMKKMDPSPLSLIMANSDMVREYAETSTLVNDFFKIFPEGPFTLLLPLNENGKKMIPNCIVKDGHVGVRVPQHDFPRKITQSIGPITSTSANVHGDTPPKSLSMVTIIDADLYIDDGPCLYGEPSTILRENNDHFQLVRQGAMKYSILMKYLGENIGQ